MPPHARPPCAARRRVIADQFSTADRERFHNLLKLAAESPFEGERENALAAARRLAGRFGMSLAEAAADSARQQQPAPQAEPPRPSPAASFAYFFHLSEAQLAADKARRDASRQAAFARGLDAEERREQAAPRRPAGFLHRAASARRMDPQRHARNLLLETSLPLREVVRLTGLSVWEVVGLKLKLRLDLARRRN